VPELQRRNHASSDASVGEEGHRQYGLANYGDASTGVRRALFGKDRRPSSADNGGGDSGDGGSGSGSGDTASRRGSEYHARRGSTIFLDMTSLCDYDDNDGDGAAAKGGDAGQANAKTAAAVAAAASVVGRGDSKRYSITQLSATANTTAAAATVAAAASLGASTAADVAAADGATGDNNSVGVDENEENENVGASISMKKRFQRTVSAVIRLQRAAAAAAADDSATAAATTTTTMTTTTTAAAATVAVAVASANQSDSGGGGSGGGGGDAADAVDGNDDVDNEYGVLDALPPRLVDYFCVFGRTGKELGKMVHALKKDDVDERIVPALVATTTTTTTAATATTATATTGTANDDVAAALHAMPTSRVLDGLVLEKAALPPGEG
jgi:hypothetical protein